MKDNAFPFPLYIHTLYFQVIIFEFPSNNEKQFVMKRILKGEQIGEYFGAALAAADVNGDGLDDLVVGSPMYSGINLKNPDRGRIQSFLSTEVCLWLAFVHYIK